MKGLISRYLPVLSARTQEPILNHMVPSSSSDHLGSPSLPRVSHEPPFPGQIPLLPEASRFLEGLPATNSHPVSSRTKGQPYPHLFPLRKYGRPRQKASQNLPQKAPSNSALWKVAQQAKGNQGRKEETQAFQSERQDSQVAIPPAPAYALRT